MITNFALSLSFEGIDMLHRVQHGWKRVGTADVEAKNLDAQLADLRRKAEAVAPDGLRTKLLIPLDQIKYLAIDSTQTTEADIHAVLDGATPYALDELVIDCERFGGRTHIAAVARETLTEAEVFAHAHGFKPVCFAAVPEPFTFQKEVFFGPTTMMPEILGPTGSVGRDPIPVLIVGTRIKSRLLVFDLPEHAIPPSEDFDLAAALAPHVSDPEPAFDAPAAPVLEPDIPTIPDEVVGAAAASDSVDEPVAETEAPEPTDEPMPSLETLKLDASNLVVEGTVGEDQSEEALDSLTSDLPDDATAQDDIADLDLNAEPLLPLEGLVDAPTEDTNQTDVPVDQDLDETTVAALEPAAPEQAPEIEVAAEPLVAQEPPTAQLHQPILFDAVPQEYHPPVVEAPAPVVVAEVTKTPVMAENPVLFVPPLFDPTIPEILKRTSAKSKKRRRLSTTSPKIAAPLPQLGAPASRPLRTVEPANTSRRPAWIAGGVAASLILVGAVAWSAFRDTDSTVDGSTVEGSAADASPEITIAEAVQSPVEDPVLPPPASIEIVAAAPTIPQIDIAGFSVAPDEAVNAPDLAIVSEPAAPALSVPEAFNGPVAQDALPAAVQPPPDPPVELPEEEIAVATVGAPVLRGTVLSPDEAETIYAATGVWQRAPRFVDVPSDTSTDGLIVPFSESLPDRVEQPLVPPAADHETDLSFLAPADPPAAEVQFPVDENGFILATPEGTVTPEGAIVYAGAPDLTIRLRPELTPTDLERMALLAPAPEGVVIIDGAPEVVPPLRPAETALPASQEEVPADLADEVATQDPPTAGAVSLAALEDPTSPALVTDAPDLRPTLRPDGLVSSVDPGTPDITAIIAGIEAETETPDTASIVNATPRAVVASLRPALRPQNFDSVVAAARANIAAQPAPTAAPVQTAAPVAPQNYAPVPGGVARAATQEDVLPLRNINLIGIYGRPNARRALVRLSNGRYVRVEVGSTLDGGQVTAISEAALNYVKRGRTLALELPSG